MIVVGGGTGEQGRPFSTPSGRSSRAACEVRPFAYLQIEEAYWFAAQARDGEVKDPQLEAREGSG